MTAALARSRTSLIGTQVAARALTFGLEALVRTKSAAMWVAGVVETFIECARAPIDVQPYRMHWLDE